MGCQAAGSRVWRNGAALFRFDSHISAAFNRLCEFGEVYYAVQGYTELPDKSLSEGYLLAI
jgi:hypothetical protein